LSDTHDHKHPLSHSLLVIARIAQSNARSACRPAAGRPPARSLGGKRFPRPRCAESRSPRYHRYPRV